MIRKNLGSEMKQILQNLKTGQTKLDTVPSPNPVPGEVLIRTNCSLISPGTEKMLVEFSKGGLLAKAKAQPDKVKQVLDKIRTDGLLPTLETVFKRLDEPLPLGYCNVGDVVVSGQEAGRERARSDAGGQEAAENKGGPFKFNVGDRVVSNGPHAEFVCVPENLCAKVPDQVTDEEAAFAVLGAIGLQGIRLAVPTLGEKFVVFGAGLVGLLTIQLLRASGCEVLAVDLKRERLELAQDWGAKVCNAENSDPVVVAHAWTEGVGADGVLIAAAAKTDEIVHQAAQMCRKRGRIVLVGVVGLNLRRADFYEKELSFQVSCSYGPGRYDETYEQKGQDYPIGHVRWTEQRNFEAVLQMMASGRLDVKPLITDRMAFEDAEASYAKIVSDGSALGVILDYRKTEDGDQRSEFRWRMSVNLTPQRKHENRAMDTVVVAMIGAGNFAKMTMGPTLAKTGARLKYVSARTNGATATHIAKKYGFEKATTDLDVIWKDPEVNTVFITTNHNSHAALVKKALSSGKHTFVEKPLCLTKDELKEIESVYGSQFADHLLMLGFNRRFSPHIAKVKELIQNRSEPLAMNFTVNAGVIPKDVWVHDPEVGGGRIIGEACHFIDLLSYICESRIVSVSAVQMGKGVAVKGDKMSIVLSFKDGSIGTVNYFGNGSNKYPKEVLEVFSEGRVLRLNNFRKLEGFGFKRFRSFRTRKMDKGHQDQCNLFLERVRKGEESPISFDEMVNVTLVSFAAVTAAREGRVIWLER